MTATLGTVAPRAYLHHPGSDIRTAVKRGRGLTPTTSGARRMLITRPGPVGWALADQASACGWAVTVAAAPRSPVPVTARDRIGVVPLSGRNDTDRIAADANVTGGLDLLAVCVTNRLIRPALTAHGESDWVTSYRRVVLETVHTVTGAAPALRTAGGGLAIILAETRDTAARPQVAASAAAYAALPVVVQALAGELAEDGIRVLAVVPTRTATYHRRPTTQPAESRRGPLRPPPIYFAHPPAAARQILALTDQRIASGQVIPLPSGMLPLELPVRAVQPTHPRSAAPAAAAPAQVVL